MTPLPGAEAGPPPPPPLRLILCVRYLWSTAVDEDGKMRDGGKPLKSSPLSRRYVSWLVHKRILSHIIRVCVGIGWVCVCVPPFYQLRKRWGRAPVSGERRRKYGELWGQKGNSPAMRVVCARVFVGVA